jgi:hypothetical protein
MMQRKWDARTKAMIVLEGLKGKPVAGLCTEHQISQSLYYQCNGASNVWPMLPKPLKRISPCPGRPAWSGRMPGSRNWWESCSSN